MLRSGNVTLLPSHVSSDCICNLEKQNTGGRCGRRQALTEQTAAGSEEMASSSEQLGAQSATLRDLVARFKTHATAGV